MAFGKIKDRMVLAVLLIAIVALTGGWVCALGWVVLKLIERKFAEQSGQHHKRWRPSEHSA